MKKRLLTIALLFIVISVISIVHTYKTNKRMSPLIFQNMEALVVMESNKNMDCGGTGGIGCPFNGEKVAYVLEYRSNKSSY